MRQESTTTREGEIQNMIVQPAMLDGMETMPMTRSHVKKQEVTEMKMCRWALGDHVRNNNSMERLNVDNIIERCKKARLIWFGHVKRRY